MRDFTEEVRRGEEVQSRFVAAMGRVMAAPDQPASASDLLDISTHRAWQKEMQWRIAAVKTDYGLVIDFTKMTVEETRAVLSEPSFLDSIVEKQWSQHPGGVLLPCKRVRNWTDKEQERLTIWKINREAEKAKRKAALADLYSVGGSAA